MPDREKVIRALEAHYPENLCSQCPYCDEVYCAIKLAEDALALLKEQEARVMTLEEIEALQDQSDVLLEEVDCIVVAATISRQGEKWGISNRDVTFFYGIASPDYERDEYYNDDYGKWWRCWTSRPTPEQMRETKWEGE